MEMRLLLHLLTGLACACAPSHVAGSRHFYRKVDGYHDIICVVSFSLDY